MNVGPEPSLLLVAAHVVLALLLAALFVRAVALAGVRAGLAAPRARGRARIFAIGLALWLGATWALARSGWLLHPEFVPPRAVFLLAPGAIVCVALALTRFGSVLLEGLPLSWLVGYQVFRILVELLLWRLYCEGVLPEQMTFEGANLDVVSGVSALFVAAILARGRRARWLVWIWNLGSLALLLNIVGIAVRSMPGPWRAYAAEPSNTIVLDSVFVWIPALYVLAAWFGHVLVLRALLQRSAPA